MERLTTGKITSEMSMIELAHNSCYADEAYNARYRDYELDIDSRELVRNLVKDMCDEDLSDMSDEEFDEYMAEMDSHMDSQIGLLAVFYRNLWAMAELREKLKYYEDLEEEHGRFLKLPCKIGDDVYFVPSEVNFKLNILNKHNENNKVYHQKVENLILTKHGWYLECDKDVEYGTGHILPDRLFNKTWFLTKSKAEAKLRELTKYFCMLEM